MSTDTLIAITINGESRDVPSGLVLPEVLRRFDFDPAQPGIAVAVNGAVVRRALWDETAVEADADLEVITATQGG